MYGVPILINTYHITIICIPKIKRSAQNLKNSIRKNQNRALKLQRGIRKIQNRALNFQRRILKNRKVVMFIILWDRIRGGVHTTNKTSHTK